jgi:trans-aconitate 2-methyltransferase
MPRWDDRQYLRFADQRTRPAAELLARVPIDAASYIVDLGCGPGNSTDLLWQRWPAARIVGVDDSQEMLARARADFPDREWVCSDAVGFRPEGPLDLLFANALLQWLPEHAAVFPALLAELRPGGVLAVQVPDNFAEPSHRAMRELGAPWDERLKGVRASSPVESPAFYYDLLAPRSQRVDIWRTTYEQVMPDAASIVEWVKGTGIRPFLALLSPQEQTAYLEAYTRAIDAAYPPRSDGKRLFSFPRLFIVALR